MHLQTLTNGLGAINKLAVIKMKRRTIIAISILFSFLRVSGQDTIWFNEFWHKTTKDKAVFYRLQSKDSLGFKVIDHYKSGVIQMTGYSLSNDSLFKVGDYCYFDENGKLKSQGKYTNNKRSGTWNQYYANGQLYYTRSFIDDGKIDGNALYYYPDGKLKRSENYSKGLQLSGNCFTNAGTDTAYFAQEEMPEFKGGEQKMKKFLTDNLIYPEKAWARGIQGIVYVSFVVDEKGRIKDIKIVKGVDILLNSAAVDVVSIMPKWKPGRIEGKPVKIQINLPITFKLH